MTDLERLQSKKAGISKISRKEVLAELSKIEAMVRKANTIKAIAGIIPQSILDAIESALNVVVPLTAFLGDFELTSLLSALKIWLQKKKLEAQKEDEQRDAMNNLGYDAYWTAY